MVDVDDVVVVVDVVAAVDVDDDVVVVGYKK